MAIPKVIYQTYTTKDLPLLLRENVARLKEINPDYHHELYDDTDIEWFIASRYGSDMLRTYRRINPRYGAARADLFRYLLIYKCGGVYLDIKSRTTRPLDEVLHPDDELLLSHWSNQPGEDYAGWGLHDELKLPQLPEGRVPAMARYRRAWASADEGGDRRCRCQHRELSALAAGRWCARRQSNDRPTRVHPDTLSSLAPARSAESQCLPDRSQSREAGIAVHDLRRQRIPRSGILDALHATD